MIQNSTAEKISVVVPVYNEEENVGLLIDRIQNSLKENDFEILLVDDGSTDRTRQVVKEINNPNVVLVELKKIMVKVWLWLPELILRQEIILLRWTAIYKTIRTIF